MDALTVVLAFVQAHVVHIVLGGVAIRILYLLYVHPLANIPGPRLAALTDLWKSYHAHKGQFSTALHEQHARYGDIVRIGPNEVSIIAPDDVKALYGHKTEYVKGPFYDSFAVGGTAIFSERDPVAHGIRRSAVASAYSLNYLTTLEQFCDTCTETLLQRLDQAAESVSVCDLTQFMDWYAYDSVSGIAFGTFFGFLEKGADDAGLLKELAKATRIISTAGTSSNFGWILPTKFGAQLASIVSGGNGTKFLVDIGVKMVKERKTLRETDRATYDEKKDMLYRFMEATYGTSSTLVGAQSQSLLRNTLSIIIAGADTTKVSMTAFLRFVYTHPATLELLRKEIDDAIDAGTLSFPISYSQASRLEFLSACIKEAMRLHPAVGMTLQRVVPQGGRVIGGRFYPEGTLVGMSPREVHNDPRAYGKDASTWRPERWIEEDRNELEKYNLGFGQGARVCLGKNISLMEMSKLLPTIIYHYDIVVQNPTQPWKVFESWFANQFDFFCTVKKRGKSG